MGKEVEKAWALGKKSFSPGLSFLAGESDSNFPVTRSMNDATQSKEQYSRSGEEWSGSIKSPT